MQQSFSHKGRILYYSNEKRNVNTARKNADSPLCGLHVDHCAFTGLLPSIYFDPSDPSIEVDHGKGLQILPYGSSDLESVELEEDSIGFQIGETAQMLTYGVLRATPHSVQPLSTGDDNTTSPSRASFALFMQPDPKYEIFLDDQFHDSVLKPNPNAPQELPDLRHRFSNGMTFAEFAERSFQEFSRK